MKHVTKRNATLAALLIVFLTCIVGGICFWRSSARHASAASDSDLTEFLQTFTAVNGSVAVEDDEMVFTLSGSGASAEVSYESYSSGSRWYIKNLTSRSVLLLSLKNDTNATALNIYFRTRTQKTFDDTRCFTIPIQADGEYHTYYVDLSENAQAIGVLYGFRFSVNAESGSFSINHVSCERENVVSGFAGSITSCTADGYRVTVTGTLLSEYANSEVTLYRTGVENMSESLGAKYADQIATVKAVGTDFSFSVPFHDGEVTMLSSKFIAAVGETKVSRMFDIENWRDFTENPYAFETKDYSVSVLDYGAKGDSVTDDTAAIQRAIDEVSAAGGGTVVLDGSEEPYGRRYVATTVRLKDNVELRIETGATLWQSPNEKDYTYDYRKGHDCDGITWGHNGLTYNYPLVYGNGAKNIKITGGGTVRLCDMGSDTANAGYTSYSVYCANLIHLIPIGLYDCTNVEITDITVLRTNCYHMLVYACENVYIGNVNLTECNCLSGDGISIGAGTKNLVVDRCFLYTNDDAIVIVAHSIAEPRGVLWWSAKADGEDNRVRNVTVRHSAITPGNIITLVLWGTDASDWTWQAINGVYVYDNILGERYPAKASDYGSSCINVWAEQRYPYGGGTGSTAPCQNFIMLNNSYRGSISNVGAITGKTNWVVDCGGIVVPSTFADPTFIRQLGRWEYGGEYKQNVDLSAGTVVLNLDSALAEQFGTPSLYQGLYLTEGTYEFSANVLLDGGAQAKLFVRQALSYNELFSETVTESNGNAKLTFDVTIAGVYLIGVEGAGSEGTVKLSQYAISCTDEVAANTYFSQDFESDSLFFNAYGWEIAAGEDNAVFVTESTYSDILLNGAYSAFDLKFEFRATEKTADGFAYVRFGGNQDYYRFVYDNAAGTVSLEQYVAGVNKAVKTVLKTENFSVYQGCWVQFGISLSESGSLKIYADGELVLSAEDVSLENGSVRLGFAGMIPELDNVTVAQAETLAYEQSPNYVEPAPDVETPDDGNNGDDGKPAPDNKDPKDNTLWIVLGVLGGVVVLGGAAAAVVIILKKKNKKGDQ